MHISSLDQEILVDERREKFLNILKINGITDKVENLTLINPPELKGQHMASATAYLRVDFKDSSKKPKNLFVKMFTNNPIHTEIIKNMQVMEKESTFFNDFLPVLKNFCKDYPCNENLIDFFPKCLYGDDEMIVLENVVVDDTFVMLAKEEYQDLFTAKFVLKNLAKFHGATYAFIETTGREEFQKKWPLVIKECLDSDNNPFVDQMFDNGLKTCLNILREFPVDCQRETINQLTDYIGKTSGIIKENLCAKPEEKMWVLNHGDCWNNNVMFKIDRESGKVMDIIFVDLQLTRLGSPCLDIGHFLFRSVKPVIRRENLKELLQHYFAELKSTVESFNRNLPIDFEEFFNDYKRKCSFGFFSHLNAMCAIEAMNGIDLNAEEDINEMFTNAVKNWTKNNPTKAQKLSLEVVEILREFNALSLTNNNTLVNNL